MRGILASALSNKSCTVQVLEELKNLSTLQNSEVSVLGSIHKYCINPLTTNDNYSHHRNSAVCYQLAQSVLKIGSVLAERVGQGEVGGYTALPGSAWRLLQLAIEWAWSALDGLFFCFLVQTGVENCPFTVEILFLAF